MPEYKPSRYGIHKRKFGRKVFRSYGIGNFFGTKAAADRMAESERRFGSETKVVKVAGGYRLFLRDKPKKRRKKY